MVLYATLTVLEYGMAGFGMVQMVGYGLVWYSMVGAQVPSQGCRPAVGPGQGPQARGNHRSTEAHFSYTSVSIGHTGLQLIEGTNRNLGPSFYHF